MFSLPQGNDSDVEGLSDEKPIRLEGITADDFKQLLKVLYPKALGTLPDLTPDEWISVLTLATKWDMPRVRDYSIETLLKLLDTFPHILVNLGHKFDIHPFILAGIGTLVKRKMPMGQDDVDQIGIRDVLKIAGLRECCYYTNMFHDADPTVLLERGAMVGIDQKIDAKIKSRWGLVH